MTVPTLHGARVTLRPPAEGDVPALVAVLRQPGVARFWGAWDEARVRRELLGEGRGWVVLVGEQVAGWVEFDEETDPCYRRVGLDIALSPSFHGRGLGPEALALVVRHFAAQGHHRFTIDPAADNQGAIRAYESMGFRRIGVARRYERLDDGEWHDNVLMDLLADELREL